MDYKLPYELILRIANYLQVDDIISLCRTNKQFSNICEDWLFWSKLAEKNLHFPPKYFFANNSTPVLRYLRIKFLIDDIDSNFFNAIQNGDAETINILLHYVDPSEDQNEALIEASRRGYVEIVDMLLKDPRVNPNDMGSGSISLAAAEGRFELVKRLLEDPRIDPNGTGDEGQEAAIVYASLYGYYDIVKILLNDFRVNPSIQYNQAIIDAAENGHYEVVKLLMDDNRVDPSDQGNLAIMLSSKKNHCNIVKLLRTDQRVNFTT